MEDEFIISMDVDATLREANVAEVRHFTTCKDALQALETTAFDAAILDANVVDGSTDSVASKLRELGVPFLLYTGSKDAFASGFGDAVRLLKPVSRADLVSAMIAALAGPRSN